jgi:hypothetical protein
MRKTLKDNPKIKKLFACKTEKQVYQLIKKEGIKGCIQESDKCPLAKYVNKATKKIYHVYAGGVNLNGRRLQLPAPCCDFYHNFDIGKYPDLEI